ncbi:MAG: GIY-YIG nuclease family protein [Proteobacteria bacterium]|nr:GIY-YIG nuclease family protein [Pseudomonadota bacterium]
MFYVYILKGTSRQLPSSQVGRDSSPLGDGQVTDRFYVGCTSDLKRRLAEHNRGDSTHTNQYRPWRLINYFAFVNREKAQAFERYLKSRAGRRFQLRHFGE